jgi:hypothetical protein
MKPYLLAPRFAANRLWLAAREVPSWHIAPARTGNVRDLVTGADLVTFTNSSPAWGFNSSGVLVQPTANVPFIEYDPATGACLGWRVWDAVTNGHVNTEDFTTGAWTKFGGSMSANVGPSPDGGTNADGLVESVGVSEPHGFRRNYSYVSGTQITLSVFVSKGSRNFAAVAFNGTAFGGTSTQAFFDLTLGTVATAFNCTAQIQRCANGVFRCSVTATPTVTTTASTEYRSTNVGNASSYVGDGSTAGYFWGAQINTGPLAPYVPATGALTASSTADVASITGAAFAGIWNQAAGTVYSDIRRLSAVPSGFPRAWQASDGTSVNRIEQTYYSNGQANVITTGGTNQAEWYPSFFAENGVKAAIAFATNDVAGASNGVITGTDNLATMPAVDRIFIGSENGSANNLRGYIRDMAILKSRRPNANLQAMTQ